MHRFHRLTRLLTRYLASDAAFYTVLALFGLGVLWVATFSVYPMAFDEEFHYGLIKIYATSLLPYGIEHTSDMAQFGAATADASYLFHYLMSFPYRALVAIGLSDTAIIITLRYLNVTFVLAAIVVFRNALRHTGASSAITTTSLAFVTLIPVFVMLAAQINYDNLLLLITAWALLLLFRLTTSLRATGDVSLKEVWLLACALLIGMSIKYAFLPIALAFALWLAIFTVRHYLRRRTVSAIVTDMRQQWKILSRKMKITLISLLLMSVFFASHYVTNFASYGSPIPDCDQVFSAEECQAYGPWSRNKLYESEKTASFVPLSYPVYMATEWFPGMTERLTFALAGKTNGFQTKTPLPIVIVGFSILAALGSLSLLVQILRRQATWVWSFTLFLTFVYVGALSYQLYSDYLQTARPVAINGRYLLPLLPLVSLTLIQAIRISIRRLNAQNTTLLTLAIFILLFIGGGGVITYIVQSEAHWYWPGFAQSHYDAIHPAVDAAVPFRFTN